MKRELEHYIYDHISQEDKELSDLFRKTHTSVVNPNMISGHLQGIVLRMIVNMISPLRILEIGTYTGYSAISMAKALPGNGILHTIEINDELHELSMEYFVKSGVSEKIIVHTGDAKEIVPTIDETFNLVFIDGDKREYLQYYDLVFDKVTPGGYILADNVLWGGRVSDPDDNEAMTKGIREFNSAIKNDTRVEKVILPLRDGLMLIRKKK